MLGSFFRSEISPRKGMAVDLIPARLSTQGEVLRISVGTSVTGISFKLLSTPPADNATFLKTKKKVK